MAAGFEAKARISVDTSQLVRASREAARAIGTLTAASREASSALTAMERSGRSAAQSLRPFVSMMQSAAGDSRETAAANQQLSQGLRESAQAFNSATAATQTFGQTQNMTSSSVRRMAREIVDTDTRLEQLRRAMDVGVNTNGELDNSYRTLRQRLQELRQSYDSLSNEQQQAVRSQMDLVRAQREAGHAARDADALIKQLNQSRMEEVRVASQAARVNEGAMRTLARNIDQTVAQYRALAEVRRQNGTLDTQQQAAMRSLTERVRALRMEYQALTAQERAAVTSARELRAAQQSASEAMSTLARTAPQAAAGVRELGNMSQALDGSLWALRASVGEIEGMLFTLQATSIAVTASMWDNFSRQEMAIAQISRVSQATAFELDGIVDQVRSFSREIPIAFDELARITMLGSQVGVANDALANFTETVALFSATSEVSAEDTATLLARIMQLSGVDDSQVMNLGSSIAYLGSNSAATDAEILNTVESISTIGNQAGLSETAIVGLGGAMASLRIRPELARGAMQRVFNQLEQGVLGTGAAMERLVEVTGKTQAELIALTEQDQTDEFYFSIIEGLNKLQASGENLVPVLREMGIINTRDVDVLARLAANWDVLDRSVRDASTAFEDGTYLYAESDRIFSTLTARVQLMANAWNELMFDAVQAVAPFITKLVEGTTEAIRFAQSIGAAPLIGFAAIALAGAAALGTLGLAVGAVVRGFVAWRGITLALNNAMVFNTGATTANTAATTANAGATAANTGVKAANAAASTAAAAANTGLAASATAASRAMLAMAVANPATTILVAVSAVLALSTAMDTLGGSTDRAQQKLLDAHDTHLNAAGGLDALTKAIDDDTAAWRNAQQVAQDQIALLDNTTSAFSNSADQILRNSRYRIEMSGEMSEADRIAAEEAQELAERQESLSEQLRTGSQDADTAADALDRLGTSAAETAQRGVEADNSIGQINGALQDNTQMVLANQKAIGLATRQWAALSLESASLESGILETEKAFQVFQESGADLSVALTKEMQNAGDGAEYLRERAAAVRDEMGFLEGFLSSESAPWGEFWYSEAERAARGMEYMADNLDATSLSIEEANRQTELMADTLIKLPDGTQATVDQLQEFTGAGGEAAIMAEVMESEISQLGISIDTLSTAFTGFIDPLQAWNDAQSEANRLAQEADEGFSELGVNASVTFTDFLANMEAMSQSQMSWAQNLLAIADEVPPHVLAGLTEMGVDGAGIVAGLVNASDTEVQRFVELWEQGAGGVSDTFSVMFSDFLTQAASSGDQGGVDFVVGLMEEVAAGDISFREAVDQMTTYAEEEFQNADTENTPTLENTEALRELTELITRIENDIDNADDTVKPEFSSGSFWGSIGSWWSSVKEWWRNNVSGNLRVSPQVTGDYSGGGSYGPLPRKDGGWVSGPGGTRQDKIHTMLSDEEFVVNARSARQFAPLLEWINSQNGGAGAQMLAPSFVPEDIFRLPRRSLSSMRDSVPMGVSRSLSTVRRPDTRGWSMTINNHFPQAEPTSVTVNRGLAYVAALDGVD